MERCIEITDQGGLVKLNKEFYSFELEIEEVACSFMTVDLLRKNQKDDLRDRFEIKLKIVLEVSAMLVSLSRKIPNRQLSEKIF